MATKAATHTTAQPKNVVERVEKPEKPDEEVFKAASEVLEKELQEIREKLKAVQDKISQVEPQRSKDGATKPTNPVHKRQSELRAELSKIREEQAGFKGSRTKVLEQLKQQEATLKARQTEQKAAKTRVPFKSVADIDADIARLEKQIETGSMKIVDERKALDTISSHRRHKKTLQGLDAEEGGITELKTKVAQLKAQLTEDPEQKKLSDRYTEITTELDKIKADQDELYKNLNSLRDERTSLRGVENEKKDAKWKLDREFHAAKNAYRSYEKKAYEARRDRIRAEREAKDKEYKMQIAAQKMEEASQPAYQAEIYTCEGLIAHFDPTAPEAQAAATKPSLLKDAGLKALATRVVNAELKGMKLVKEEVDYFVGKPKKGKKGSNKGSGAVTPTTPVNAEEKEKGKFQLNHSILSELGKVDVRAPTKWDDVPACVEKLREKLNWYKEHSERVTKENIAKAQKEIDRLEGKGSEETASPDAEEEESFADPPKEEKEEEEEKPLPVPATTEADNDREAQTAEDKTEEKAE